MTREQMLTEVTTLTGATAEEATLLGILLDHTIDTVLAFIGWDFVPARAASVVVEMTCDAYRTHKAEKSEAGAVTGSIQSISDNGQSVTYRDGSEVLNASNAQLAKNYVERLMPFRKAGWH